jgi:tetratricopeptide (TPR) repeat protein
MIDHRRETLTRHLEGLRTVDGWRPFQNFVLGLLHHAGYRDIRHSNARSGYGRDAVAITPDGKRCVAAVSFESTKSKVIKDARRAQEDPNREKAEVFLFITADATAQTTWTAWKADVAELGMELRMFNRETILEIATRNEVWRETCARLRISGDRPGYRLISPYDGDLISTALSARPAERLSGRIPLVEWGELSGEVCNRLVLGKPGAGKTTTLLFHLEQTRPEKVLIVESDLREAKIEGLLDHAAGGGVIVFDDVHDHPGELRAVLSALRARQRDVPEVSAGFNSVRLLLAARSNRWTEIQHELPITLLEDFGLLGESQLQLGALSTEQCRELIEPCRSTWGLVIEPRLAEQTALAAASKEATPLYVLSILAQARTRADRTLRDEHLAHLPRNVVDLWKRYWSQLTHLQQGVLRLVKLFAATRAPQDNDLFNAAARYFSIPPHDLSGSLDYLERGLWISRDGVLPSCLDVQLEVIDLNQQILPLWDSFVHTVPADADVKARLHVGTAVYHLDERAPRTRSSAEHVNAVQAAERHLASLNPSAGELSSDLRAVALNCSAICSFTKAELQASRELRITSLRDALDVLADAVALNRGLGEQSALADSLNSISNVYLALAQLESTSDGRADLLQKALAAAGESTTRLNGLKLWDALARSLTTVSNVCAELARSQSSLEGRAMWLQRVVDTVRDAVAIRRDLGVRGELATSLNNLAVSYSELAELESSADSRVSMRQMAMESAEQAVAIYRALDFPADLARALTTLAAQCAQNARFEGKDANRVAWLQQAKIAIEEAIDLRRHLSLQGDLALSLNNASNAYSDLAELEATDAGKMEWLNKAARAIEQASAIRRDLGAEGDLGRSLGNLSNRYLDLAKLETRQPERLVRLKQAIAFAEEAVEIPRRLVTPGDLAAALRDASICYGAMAEEQSVTEHRIEWIQKAVAAIEESVAIHRNRGDRTALGASLGAQARYLRMRAIEATDEASRRKDLSDSASAAGEASQLFEAAGDVPLYVLALRDFVSSYMLLSTTGERVDVRTLLWVCERGKQLADSLGWMDEEEFFSNVLGML